MGRSSTRKGADRERAEKKRRYCWVIVCGVKGLGRHGAGFCSGKNFLKNRERDIKTRHNPPHIPRNRCGARLTRLWALKGRDADGRQNVAEKGPGR